MSIQCPLVGNINTFPRINLYIPGYEFPEIALHLIIFDDTLLIYQKDHHGCPGDKDNEIYGNL